MKKLKKYSKDYNTEDPNELLKSYVNQTNHLLSQSAKQFLSSRRNMPLLGIIPIVASSLLPANIQAQCNVAIFSPSNSVTGDIPGGNLADMTIDVDGDGTIDYHLDASTGTAGGGSPSLGDLFIKPQNGAEVLCYNAGGGYYYTTRFNTNDAITSASGIWKDAPSLNNNQATLDYQSFGPWHGTGTVTGYLGLRIDGNRLGFMEVSWDNNTNTVTVTSALTGMQDDESQPLTSINAGDCPALLPVEFISFDAEVKDGKAMLYWVTGSEVNNEGFEIQRSIDGQDYRKIGWVTGQGNSQVRIDYNYEDKSISANTNYYYRLMQKDYDGNTRYSQVRNAMYTHDRGFVLDAIKPNPTFDNSLYVPVKISADAQVEISIYDAMGQQLKVTKSNILSGSQDIEIDISDIPNGIHFVKVEGNGQTSFQKVAIQK